MIPIAKPSISRREIRAVSRVLRSGKLTMGTEVKRFEQEFSRFVGGRDSVAALGGGRASGGKRNRPDVELW